MKYSKYSVVKCMNGDMETVKIPFPFTVEEVCNHWPHSPVFLHVTAGTPAWDATLGRYITGPCVMLCARGEQYLCAGGAPKTEQDACQLYRDLVPALGFSLSRFLM